MEFAIFVTGLLIGAGGAFWMTDRTKAKDIEAAIAAEIQKAKDEKAKIAADVNAAVTKIEKAT